MKEIKLYESWVESLVLEANSRPVPLSQDLKHAAVIKYPDLEPEQAVLSYIADKLQDSEKIDNMQNKKLSVIDQEVDQVDSELDNVEDDEAQIKAEINRLQQLINTR